MRDVTKQLVVALNSDSATALEQMREESSSALEQERQKTARYQRENIKAQHLLANRLSAAQDVAARAAANLEAEKKKRVELAASLSPRDFFDQSGAIAKLSGLPPMNVIFEYPDEREPRNIAQEINFVFDVLHWNAFRRRVPEEWISEGIHVLVGRRPVPSSILELHPEPFAEQMAKGQIAAKALCDGLRQSDIDVETEPLGLGEVLGLMATEDVAADTLVVMVGLKRNRVLEETLKELGPVHATMVGRLIAGSNRTSIREEAAGPTKPK